VPGHNYRVTVCHGRIVKTTVRRAGGVVGDGVSSVADLVASHKTDAQAQFRRIERGRDLLTLDGEALDMLAEAGMTAESVPVLDEYVALRRRSNVSTGGSTTDISGQLHPDNEQLFLRTAHLLGLDLAAIDYISPDITRSWHDVPSGICEVNAQPQLSNDLNPRLYHDVLREYLGADTRIPWTVVLGNGDLDDGTRALAERIRQAASFRCSPAVLACGDGVWVGGSRVSAAQENSFDHWDAAAVGRFAASAIVVADGQHLLASGLPSDLIDFIVLPASHGRTQRDRQLLAACLTLALPHLHRGILLDAEDPALSALKSQLSPRHLILLSTASPTDLIRAHLAAGGRAAWIGERMDTGEAAVIFADGAMETPLGHIDTAGMDDRSLGDALIACVVRCHLPQRPRKAPAVQ
jgi:cyanophycin synthetase